MSLIVAFILIFAFCVYLVVRLGSAVMETLAWSISGETGGLMYQGFMPKHLRIHRTAEIQVVVSHLGLITRANLPLVSALRACGKGETGRVGRALNYMSYLVGTGWPVSETLRAAFRGCPPQLTAILRNGERVGRLPQAVADAERMIAVTVHGNCSTSGYARYAWTYALVMFVACSLILAQVMVVQVPMFKEIFLDFDQPLPGLTLTLVAVSQWFGGIGWAYVLAFVAWLILAAILGARLRAAETPGVFSRIVGTLRLAMPITRTIDYGLGMASVIRSMATGMGTGAAPDRVATFASTVSATNHLRRRLDRFARDVQSGVVPHKAARASKLGDVFVSALKMVERGEDPERVLGHAADYYEAIAHRWWHALSAAVAPLTTLFVAVAVGSIALAMFLPLVALIEGVTETIP